MRDEMRANYDGALKFAEAAIKSAFALNGGGAVALPALTALLKIEPKPAATCSGRWRVCCRPRLCGGHEFPWIP
jgi:hypothetical protein